MNVNEKVAEKLVNAGPTVVDAVVEHLVKKEIDRRTKAVLDGLESLQKQEKELKKVKPDSVIYAADGKVATEGWTKQNLEGKNKMEKNVAKLREALDAALDKADYGKLFNLNKPDENPTQAPIAE